MEHNRNEYKNNKDKIFPESLYKIIFKLYYYSAVLLPFDTNNVCDKYSSKQVKLSNNNCTATKMIEFPFCWIISKLNEGIKKGIHVFRYKIDNKEKGDIMWGVAPFNKKPRYTSYGDRDVLGWYSTGTAYGKKKMFEVHIIFMELIDIFYWI